MSNLTDAKYWNDRHRSLAEALYKDSFHNIEYLFPVFDTYIKDRSPGKTAFEFGCVPGQGLLKFCRRYGFTPSGCDFSEQIDMLNEILKGEFPESRFYNIDISGSDFSEVEPSDVVLSNGLIEHFDDVTAILAKHHKILKDDGLLILNTPNLSPLRALIWRIFDPVLLKGHNPEATDLRKTKDVLEKMGFEVLESGYFGKPHIWLENPTLAGAAVVRALNLLFRRLGMKNKVSMPFVYWIAKKKPPVSRP